MDGRISPCCRFNELDYSLPLAKNGIAAAVNGEVFTDIRERMLSGEKLPNCNKCWKQEQSVGTSLRTIFNDRYPTAISDNKLRFLEIGFSTHCNLACRMCGPDFSSKWSTIKNPASSVKMGYELDIDWFDIDMRQLDLIKIVGGEPMLARQHAEFVKLLSVHDISDMKVVYFTNGTIMPSKEILEFWSKLKKVVINVSIDGVNEINEYQRPGATWNTIEKVIAFYKTLDNININIHTVVTPLNIKHLHRLHEWVYNTFGTLDIMSIDTVEDPHHLALRNMSDEIKNEFIKYLEDNIEFKAHSSQLLNVINSEARDEIVFDKSDIRLLENDLDVYFKQESIL
jgi:MoaA/NifB/PqqE/SkfB family radical SAM enzyme